MATVALTVGAAMAGCADAGAESPGVRQSVVENVEFYPACGNETLQLDGTTWYSFEPDDPALFPTPQAMASGDWAASGMSRGAAPVAAVVAPGPGDDTGNLVIYEGGFAYFRSHSGELTSWLTTDAVEYNFVC